MNDKTFVLLSNQFKKGVWSTKRRTAKNPGKIGDPPEIPRGFRTFLRRRSKVKLTSNF